MERIKLTKREKRIMRLLHAGNSEALSDFDAPSIAHLATIGLANRAGVEGGGFDDACLSTMGKEYFDVNPRLRNPINWSLILAAIAAIAAVAALFISCTKL
ncbi:MAG: hypothetical protein IJ775_02815 [Muribaculaceae bacterium]|nr:hypothetical protein [Muribaculaceae bacterium]